jgi:hypothetical protein
LEERLWDALRMARIAISNAAPDEQMAEFDVALGKETVHLWVRLDDGPGPAVHIVTPPDD